MLYIQQRRKRAVFARKMTLNPHNSLVVEQFRQKKNQVLLKKSFLKVAIIGYYVVLPDLLSFWR